MYLLKNSWKRQCHKILFPIFKRFRFPSTRYRFLSAQSFEYSRRYVALINFNDYKKAWSPQPVSFTSIRDKKSWKPWRKRTNQQKGTEIRGNRFIQAWSKKNWRDCPFILFLWTKLFFSDLDLVEWWRTKKKGHVSFSSSQYIYTLFTFKLCFYFTYTLTSRYKV